jgi:hypothetical protein
MSLHVHFIDHTPPGNGRRGFMQLGNNFAMNLPARIAYHEAGHAVAAVLRDGSSVRPFSITSADDYPGSTCHLWPGRDPGFVAWAGPWAQARAEWCERSLDGGGDGVVFADYLLTVHLSGSRTDWLIVEQHFASLPWASMRAGTERVWGTELTRMWPAIQQVAEWLLVGEPVTDQRVRDLTDADMALT